MKIYHKIALWIIGIIGIIFLPDANLYYQRFKVKSEKLPEIYKNYKVLDSIEDKDYEVKKFEGGLYKPVRQLNDSTILIIYTNSEETKNGSRLEEKRWYKINLKGQITDSIKYSYNDREEDHKSFRDLEPDQKGSKEIEYEHTTYDVDNNLGLIQRKYVKKEEWVGHTFWDSRTFSYGGGGGGGRIGWYGTSFFDLKMPDKTLHFTQPVKIEYPDEGVRDQFAYHIYRPKNGTYLLLSDIQNARYFIVRPKANLR